MTKNLLLSLLLLIVFSSCLHHNHNLSIQVKDSDDEYEFYASYPDHETNIVQEFVNDKMSPQGLYSSAHDYFNVDTRLDDGTNFHVKSSPGYIKINLVKHQNSSASIYRIQQMCEGIKLILTKQ